MTWNMENYIHRYIINIIIYILTSMFHLTALLEYLYIHMSVLYLFNKQFGYMLSWLHLREQL